MAKQVSPPRSGSMNSEQRRLRRLRWQRIFFVIMAVILIITWIASLIIIV